MHHTVENAILLFTLNNFTFENKAWLPPKRGENELRSGQYVATYEQLFKNFYFSSYSYRSQVLYEYAEVLTLLTTATVIHYIYLAVERKLHLKRR